MLDQKGDSQAMASSGRTCSGIGAYEPPRTMVKFIFANIFKLGRQKTDEDKPQEDDVETQAHRPDW